MKLKLDAAGNAVLQDGQPVYTHADGREAPFDAAGTMAAITRLNKESQTRREQKEALEEKLRAYESIPDPAAAVAALEIVGKLDQKKLIEAGEVDRVKAEIKANFDQQLAKVEEKYKPIVRKASDLEGQLKGERVTNAFGNSKFIGDKMSIPLDLVRARFGSSFDVVDGQVVAVDKDGRPLSSRNNPLINATFDEGLEILVDAYPYRDSILKGTGSSGGGAHGGGGGNNGGKKLTRREFETLEPAARMQHIKDKGQVVDAVG